MATRTVLFLCTGNYYRSRFAEMYFNHVARQRGLTWRAVSRGLATETNHLLPGVISPLTANALEVLGVDCPDSHRDAIQCTDDDMAAAELVIGVKETEHRPLVQSRFPRFADRVQYWEVHDIHDGPPDAALAELQTRIDALVRDLAARQG